MGERQRGHERDSHLPFGGRAGSASGGGRVGGRFTVERLTELETIVVNME